MGLRRFPENNSTLIHFTLLRFFFEKIPTAKVAENRNVVI